MDKKWMLLDADSGKAREQRARIASRLRYLDDHPGLPEAVDKAWRAHFAKDPKDTWVTPAVFAALGMEVFEAVAREAAGKASPPAPFDAAFRAVIRDMGAYVPHRIMKALGMNSLETLRDADSGKSCQEIPPMAWRLQVPWIRTAARHRLAKPDNLPKGKGDPMKSKFNTLSENAGKAWHTRAIPPASRRRLAIAAAWIRRHVLEGREPWTFRAHKGSLTFQSNLRNHQVIKLFIDVDNALARSLGIEGLPADPIVAGFELWDHLPPVREAIRDFLAARFGGFYLDPRRGASKYWLQPKNAHFYDLVFIPGGACGEEVEEDEVEFFLRILEGELPDEEAEPRGEGEGNSGGAD